MGPCLKVQVQWSLPNRQTLLSNLEYKFVYVLGGEGGKMDPDTRAPCLMNTVCGSDSCGTAITDDYQQFDLDSSTFTYSEIFFIYENSAIASASNLLFNMIARDKTQPITRSGVYSPYNSKQDMSGKYILIVVLALVPVVVIVLVAVVITARQFGLDSRKLPVEEFRIHHHGQTRAAIR